MKIKYFAVVLIGIVALTNPAYAQTDTKVTSAKKKANSAKKKPAPPKKKVSQSKKLAPAAMAAPLSVSPGPIIETITPLAETAPSAAEMLVPPSEIKTSPSKRGSPVSKKAPPPVVAPKVQQKKVVNLKTQSSNEIGLTISSYTYQEPGVMTEKATNYGIEYQGTYAFGNNWWVLGGIDYNNGKNNYSGSGTLNGIPTYYYNLKGVIGYDFTFSSYNLSQYVGIGYRRLNQQMAGMTSSTGHFGYDRQSSYNYLPIGLIHRMALGSKAKLETTFEYDHLIVGNQFSGLSAGNGPNNYYPDINNTQYSGFGLNLSIMYKEDKWGIGPYMKYWNIQQSEAVAATTVQNGVVNREYYVEPANTTKEYGIKAIYRF